MPVKARRPKRRTSDAADLEAWKTLFETGFDYFNDLGFGSGPHSGPERSMIRKAWHRRGATFLARREQPRWAREVPWALETFGEPPCR